jgi:hypothetical protein
MQRGTVSEGGLRTTHFASHTTLSMKTRQLLLSELVASPIFTVALGSGAGPLSAGSTGTSTPL